MTTQKLIHDGALHWNDEDVDADKAGDFDTVTTMTAIVKASDPEFRALLLTRTAATGFVVKNVDISYTAGWLDFWILVPATVAVNSMSIMLSDASDTSRWEMVINSDHITHFVNNVGINIADGTSDWVHISLDITSGMLHIRGTGLNVDTALKWNHAPSGNITKLRFDVGDVDHMYLGPVNYSSATPAIQNRTLFLQSNPGQALHVWIAENWSSIASWSMPDVFHTDVDFLKGLNMEDISIVIEDTGYCLYPRGLGASGQIDGTVRVAITHPAFQNSQDPWLKGELFKNSQALGRLCTQYRNSINVYWGMAWLSSAWSLRYNENTSTFQYQATFTLKRSLEED